MSEQNLNQAQAPAPAPEAAPAVDNQPPQEYVPHGTSPDAGSQAIAPEADPMPWLMRDKFKGQTMEEVIANQAKAYPELLSKMGKYWGAPKEGDYSPEVLSEFGIDKSDPIFTALAPVLKDMGISNEGVRRLAAGWEGALNNLSSSMQESLTKSMTPELAQTVGVVDNWLSDRFTKDEAERIKSWMSSPEDFKILNTLRVIAGGSTNVPHQGASHAMHFESSESIRAEKVANNHRYTTDMAYRKDLARREKDALLREERARQMRR